METIITIKPHDEPERYEAFYKALMSGTEIAGSVVTCYSEYHEAGELICKFTLQPPEPNQHDDQ